MLSVAEKPMGGGKIMTAEEFVDQLQQDCLDHPALNHSYLKKFEAGKVDKKAIRIFGENYYCFSRYFSRYLAALVAITPFEASRAPLIKNLHEEYGGRQEENRDMDPELTHPAIFRRFLRSVGVDTSQETLDAIKPIPETKLFVDKYLNIRFLDYITAFGALGPGTEYIVPKMYTYIREGCKKAGLSDDEVLFFTAHIELDVEHAEGLKEGLIPFAQTEENQEKLRFGAMDFLDARTVLWDGLERASGL
ncbi:MAG: PQQ biosynthesis protein C [Candidatus Scalindua rubra]|uniref:PQQ biosynthesis protein C n=1 Tax=Candidatus Scalindua rubra TaxID=1872076 RepID=A0A1E3XDL0_9BACT|nr:MAG: PQQ biosynthesis protein C [Candidatus Scalindua rubra]